MSVYERELEKEDLDTLVKDFTNRPDFEKAVQKIDEPNRISGSEYDEVKGFEVINEMDFDDEKLKSHELTLYIKYKGNTLIKLTELKVKGEYDNKEKILFTVEVGILESVNNKSILKKFFIDDGDLTLETTIEDPNDKCIEIPEYLEVPSGLNDVTPTSIVPCFNWDGSGSCCEFRYNGNPFNPLVEYNWCGANCGGGCSNSPGMENDLDSCCKLHDCCYVNNSSYPDRCSCDQTLINCARRTDNAGGSRVITAFQGKMLAQGC